MGELLYSLLKIWKFNIETVGLELFDSTLGDFVANGLITSTKSIFERGMNVSDCFSFILFGKVMVKKRDYKDARCTLVRSIRLSTSLYSIILSLRYLSEVCMELDHCVIALRLLNVAYKLCTKYDVVICPSFVNKKYLKKKERIKQKLNKMVCSHCGRKGKLKCCTACMSSYYCSKSCQKREWRLSHRDKCDKEWTAFYKVLRDELIFCV